MKFIEAEILKLFKPLKLGFDKVKIKTDIHPNNVIIKTLQTGISPGTETSAYVGKEPLRKNIRYPRLMGYCNIGEVIYAGSSAVSYLNKIVLTHLNHCTYSELNSDEILAIIPPKADLDDYILSYLYVIANSGIERPSPPPQNNGVIGLGLLGLMASELLITQNKNISVFSNHLSSLVFAKQLGIRNCFHTRGNRKFFLEEAQLDIDKILLFSNKWEDWDLTRKIINPYGEISILGFPGRGEALPRYNILEPKYFYQKQLTFSYVGRIEGSKEKKIDYLKKSLESIFLKIKKKHYQTQKIYYRSSS